MLVQISLVFELEYSQLRGQARLPDLRDDVISSVISTLNAFQ
jgi:hypothetical protein